MPDRPEPDRGAAQPHSPATTDEPIAVIGMGCRFPDANDPAALLDVVLTGRRAFRRLPPCRMDLLDYYSADPATPDATYSTRAAVLEGWQFDWNAFGVPEPVYLAADPAHWLALETAARALAAAGFPGGTGLALQRTGVIIGNTLTGDSSRAAALRLRWPYVRRVLADALTSGDIPRDRATLVLRHAAARYLAPFPGISDQTLAGSTPASIAARICSHFGFTGGSHAVDGSSASSLLAVAAACAALATGDLDVALAGGVDLSLDPFELVGLAKTGVLASGDMRVYDENPTGFLPGEGCGVVVLMRAADARAGGLPIYAEIAGWGVSSAGQAAHAGPDPGSQLLALNRAYQRAQVDPADVRLIEGHGSGTTADDAAELTALMELRAGAGKLAALGSIKANIGHTKAAAGSAGLIKTVLAVSTGLIPPATGFSRPHPLLEGTASAMWLPRAPSSWPDGVRIAGVSAMGTGGGNAHLVLRGQTDHGRHKRKGRSERPGETTEAMLAIDPAKQPAQPADGQPQATAYLLHAPDRKALLPVLARIAQISPWLSDAEMRDLACQLARDTREQGPVRMAIVASRQEQLARLATDAMTMLPRLADGLLAVQPGIYAADGGDGRVTLLLSGIRPGGAWPGGPRPGGSQHSSNEDSSNDRDSSERSPIGPADVVLSSLSALRKLDPLGVHGTVAVGHGLGDLAGLVWAGCLTETDATNLAVRLDEILATAQAQHSGPGERAARLRAAAAQLRLTSPHRRLISAATGRELASIPDVTEVLCAQLEPPRGAEQALKAGAIGASLLLETGPGQALSEAAPGWVRVPVVSLAGEGSGKDATRAAAALFAAGALGNPPVLADGQPSRRIDIWREQIFITNPCQTEPRGQAAPAVRPPQPSAPADAAGPAKAAASGAAPPPANTAGPAATAAAASGTASGAAPTGPAAAAAGPAAAAAASGAAKAASSAALNGKPNADRPAPGTHPTGAGAVSAGPRRSGTGQPARGGQTPGVVPGVAPWVRCFAEQLQPLEGLAAVPETGRSWRIRAATREPFRALVPKLFDDDPAADRVLAIVADPTDPDSCVAALLAAQDAISVGQLVVVTHGPGFTGFYASLHAEYPNLGITVLRVPESTDGLRAAQRLAAVQPGRFLELVVDVAGRPHETRMVPVEATGLGNFPLGPTDVVLVSRGAGGSGLALAQVLACCGAAIAVLGPDMPGSDGEGMAGLEQLRAAGARVGSEVVDLTNKADMAAAVRRIERKLGLVTAIVQAAEPSAPRPLGGLTESEMRAHVAAQTMGLSQLLDAIRPERLRLIATFGSIASRYGMGRASLLALASGSLASQAERAAETIPGCRAQHIDWPAWSGPEQAGRPAMTDRLARAGVTVIGVNEGSRLLLKMLTTPDFPASVAVHGRIGLLGRPPAAGHLTGRFLQAVRTYYPGVELVCEARISPRTDQYLADYLVDGVSVLPAAMALEALAQAASVLAGRPVRRAVGVSVDSPVVVRAGGTDPGAVIRICALRDGDTVTAVLRCEESSFAVDHVRAVFSCGLQAADAATSRGAALPELEEVAASDAGIVDGTALYGTICFQSGRFRRAALLPEVTSRSCRALVEGDDNQAWFSGLADPADAQLVLGSPGLTDATWHVLQACVPHRRLQLAGCDSVLFSGLAADGAVEVRAALARDPQQQATTASSAAQRKSAVPAQSPGPEASTPPAGPSEYVWDVEAVDSAGLPIVTWRGLRLRDTGPLARSESWPPALLAAYLERSAAALGLDPELRIAVHCGQPDGTAPRDAAHAVVPKPSPPADERPRPQALPGSGPAGPPGTSAAGPAGSAGGPLAACAATGSGALAGFTLTVWAADSVACGWAAAEPARERQPTTDQSKESRPAGGPALAGMRDDMRNRLGEPSALLDARLRAVRDCLTVSRTHAASAAVVGDGPAGERWVLVRAGGATVACTVAELTGVPQPVAIAIMTGKPRKEQPEPADSGQPRSQSRRQRGRATKHAR